MTTSRYRLQDRAAITGIGLTDLSAASGRSTLTLAAQAARAAVADAGLELSQIDGVLRYEMDDVLEGDLVAALGLRNVEHWGSGGWAGAASCALVGQAAAAIDAGMATNVLVYRSLNGRSGNRFGRQGGDLEVGGDGTYQELYLPYGVVAPGIVYATLARRHMLEFGTTREQLGAIAVACHARGAVNPRAQRFGRELTMASYLAARPIAEPLHLFDYCLETDGAAALVVSGADRAADGPHRPVLVRAVAQGDVAEPRLGALWGSMLSGPMTETTRTLAPRLYARAGLGPDDVDVAQLYDCFTITVLMQLEDFGFCAKGEGGPFAASGAIELDGTLPINTSGGNLAEGYIHGLTHVLEGVRQLRGTSTAQVPGAETCLVTAGTPGPGTSAMILRRG